MDQQTLPGGSFGAAIGGSEALKSAMQRRGMGVGATQQTSPGSVAGAPPVPTEVSMAQAALPPTKTPQTKEPDSDMQIALKALSAVTKSESDLKKSVLQLRQMGTI